ncbi:MAG: M10 family metallopeptidase C-terminal domain-containing protein [Hyphomicrobiaceae bacterium]|nr:M10 family metallopeptidase C-terminal domain-containing protein [Hyphomicrobiaceae bacterium]
MCVACGYFEHDAGDGVGSSVDGTAPSFSLAEIITQLQTQWSGSEEGYIHRWQGATVSYSLPNTAPTNLGGTPSEASGLVVMDDTMKAQARLAFELWDDLIATSLDESVGNTSADITMNYSSATSGGGTYAKSSYYLTTPDRLLAGSQIWMSSTWGTHDEASDLGFGGYGLQTYLHEIGHSLGLSHPGSYNAGGGAISYAASAEFAQDNRQYTVMSYFGGYDTSTGTWMQDESWSNSLYSSTPMLYDVAAIQALYGADMTTRAGNTVYGFNSTAGRAVFDFTQNSAPIFTIWDGGGTDTLDTSGFSCTQTLDLGDGTYSHIGGFNGNIAIAFGATIENAVGGSGADTVHGNAANNHLSGGAGTDSFFGNDGSDTIDGGQGADTMRGGIGNDTYFIDDAADIVLEGAGQGTDLVRSTISKALFGNTENLILDGVADINGSGNTAANSLIGNSGNNVLDGRAGADRMFGHGGNDTYMVDNAGDVVGETAGNGTDTVKSTLDCTLAANVEKLLLLGSADIDGTGNELDNVLVGNNGDNRIEGGDGVDNLTGGLGADTLVGGTGNNRFIFNALAESAAGACDRIEDFLSGDTIWLSAIDANSLVAGNSAFALDLNGSFSAGEIRQTFVVGGVLLEMNTDADSEAEMAILLAGRTTLVDATDLIL